MSSWPTVPIQDICEAVNVGFVGPSSDVRDPDGVPFLMGKNIGSGFLKLSDLDRVTPQFHAEQRKSQLRSGDVVVVRIGNSGQAALIPEGFGEANCAGLVIIKQPHGIDRNFLVHYLNSPTGRAYSLARAGGSTRQTLNTRTVASTPIPLPPLDEQKRIVAKLDEATAQCDQAISNQERITLEAQTLESRRLAGMFSAAADEYTLQALSDVADLDSGYAFPAAQFTTDPAAIPLLGGESIGHWAIKWASGKRWPEQASGEYGRYRLLAGDIVLAMDRPWVSTGLKVAVVDERHVPSLLIQRTARIRSRPNIDHDYLRFLLWAPQFSEYLLSVQTGVGVPHISLKQLGGFVVPVPDISVQRSMAEAAWTIHSHTFELIRTAYALKGEIETLKHRYLTAILTGSL